MNSFEGEEKARQARQDFWMLVGALFTTTVILTIVVLGLALCVRGVH